MGQIPNEIRRGTLSDMVKRALGVTRSEGGIERYGETLQPIIHPWAMPEWAYLRGERLGALAAFQSAVALEYPIIAFANPAGSNSLVVVEAAAVGQMAAVVQMELVADALLAGTLTAMAAMASGRDRRFTPAAGRFSLRAGTDLGNTFGVFLERLNSLTTVFTSFQNLPVVLRPGDDLVFIGQTVNTAMSINLSWRERLAYPGELL